MEDDAQVDSLTRAHQELEDLLKQEFAQAAVKQRSRGGCDSSCPSNTHL